MIRTGAPHFFVNTSAGLADISSQPAEALLPVPAAQAARLLLRAWAAVEPLPVSAAEAAASLASPPALGLGASAETEVPAWPHLALASPVSLSWAALWWAFPTSPGQAFPPGDWVFPLPSGSSARHLVVSQVCPKCPAAAERPWCREQAAHWPWAVPDAVSH